MVNTSAHSGSARTRTWPTLRRLYARRLRMLRPNVAKRVRDTPKLSAELKGSVLLVETQRRLAANLRVDANEVFPSLARRYGGVTRCTKEWAGMPKSLNALEPWASPVGPTPAVLPSGHDVLLAIGLAQTSWAVANRTASARTAPPTRRS